MKKILALLIAMLMLLSAASALAEGTLVYGSGDYTRINPAIDEHGEINLLIFNGLTAHDADNNVVPCLAESWDYDEATHTYTFHLAHGVTFHDGEPFTAEDVKFTIEAIMDPANESEIASNYTDVKEIRVVDDNTVEFELEGNNAAFLEYMTIGILPKHLLEGQDMQTSDYFRAPVGTGPYKLERWDEGQAITLKYLISCLEHEKYVNYPDGYKKRQTLFLEKCIKKIKEIYLPALLIPWTFYDCMESSTGFSININQIEKLDIKDNPAHDARILQKHNTILSRSQ